MLELLDCQWRQDRRLECKLGPGKSTLCEECHEVKVKCEHPRDEKLEQKWKRA